MSDDVLLTFNAGSSTLKIGVFELAPEGQGNVGRGKIDFDQSPLMFRYSIGPDRYEKAITARSSSPSSPQRWIICWLTFPAGSVRSPTASSMEA